MDKIRQYLALALDVQELPLNHLIGDVLFPPAITDQIGQVDGVVSPPFAKIGGGVGRVPFFYERPVRKGNPLDAKGTKNIRGGCNANQILMKCSMDLRQFGLDKGGGFWMDLTPLGGTGRAWIAAPKHGKFCAQDVKVQVQRAIWALQVLDPSVKNRMGEIYSVERKPGAEEWYPVYLSG